MYCRITNWSKALLRIYDDEGKDASFVLHKKESKTVGWGQISGE